MASHTERPPGSAGEHDDGGMTRRRFLSSTAAGLAAMSLSRGATAKEVAPKGSVFDEYDALGLAELVRKKKASPQELLGEAIQRMEAADAQLNAVPVRHYEEARAQIAAGLPNGPFTGVPFLLKDLHVALKGTLTTGGSRFFRDVRPDYDSDFVDRCKRAGFVIFGKTASPELGLTPTTESVLYGPTRNPWNLERVAGGSSGGAGAVVGARVLPIAQGSDGGGSIRVPAACCGVFGLKPTRGRLPLGPGRQEGWNGASVVGALSLTVRDMAAFLDACAGPIPGASYWAPSPAHPYLQEVGRAPARLRIALQKQSGIGTAVDPECVAAVEDAARLCDSLGHTVEEAAPDLNSAALTQAFMASMSVGALKSVEDRAAVLGRQPTTEDLEVITWRTVEAGRKVDGLSYARAREAFDRAAETMGTFMARYDLVLSPTLGQRPVPLGTINLSPKDPDAAQQAMRAFTPFTALYNMTGQPAMSVPLYWSADGLPVGVMFAARFGDEATLLRLAAQLERARPWRTRRPPVHA